ncbi:ROK family protein [Alkalihalobacillus pseudalcaliphilus]|uniref:ROK family protein n=1 Tax=Alkalihalobacillus pseudalcaliphilus TaxID=79884 RepID=UPI00064D9491|nr:ROK family protein [Alkalihalobacillus pseudalcaliphilus]KMK78077.1 hypothetical protein AB990_01100 [Alkalihalobacillus pseudalcaliphilus]
MNDYAIGIDIGGTKIAAGIIGKDGTVVAKERIPTSQLGSSQLIEHVLTLIRLLKAKAAELNCPIKGIGLGSAGQVHVRRGEILSATSNISGWSGVTLKKVIEEHYRLPVFIDNDVQVMALAEKRLGAAVAYQHFICLALGTGVGGGIYMDNKRLQGTWGGAAELGHTSIDYQGDLCNCGLRGCLETFASGTWIAKKMNDLQKPVAEKRPLTSEQVFDLYHEGNKDAKQVVNRMVTGLSYGIINLVHTFNPEAIILGGGVMDHNDWIVSLVQKFISGKGLIRLMESVEIKKAELGSEAGLIGAGLQVFYP